MARLDERLRDELEAAARPADPSGVYDDLIRRRERRRILRRTQTAILAVAVTAVTAAGFVALSRVFETAPDVAGGVPSPVPIVPHTNGRIAYSASTQNGMELRTVLSDGSRDGTIPTPTGLPWLPSWSPDGSKIAVAIFPLGGGDREIWVMNADGSDPVEIASAENVSVPSWSPDGSTIAYAARTDGRTEIHLAGSDGSFDRAIHAQAAPGTFSIFSAKFSPDGTQILFDRGTDSGFDIYVMNVDGTHVRELTTTGTDYDPHWSPDGTKIAFTREEIVEHNGQRRATSDIFVMNADGSDIQRLTEGGDRSTYLYPQWSPDGTKIAFVAGVTGGPGPLVVMNADGSDPVEVVSGEVLGISWQPLPAPDETSPAPIAGEDIGLGFPVCDVTSVPGRFADPNTQGIAFVATRMGDTDGCPDATGAFNVVAIDLNGDGVADTSYGPIVCENAACVAWATPDVDGDGTDELLVQNVAFSMPGLKLFDLLGDGAPGTDGLTLVPVTVAPPGSAEFGYRGFEGGTEPQFWINGDAFSAAAIRCETSNGERALVSVAAEIVPPDAPDAHWEVVETVFLLRDGELRVVDVREFTHPFFNDDVVPFLESEGCGANLRHFG